MKFLLAILVIAVLISTAHPKVYNVRLAAPHRIVLAMDKIPPEDKEEAQRQFNDMFDIISTLVGATRIAIEEVNTNLREYPDGYVTMYDELPSKPRLITISPHSDPTKAMNIYVTTKSVFAVINLIKSMPYFVVKKGCPYDGCSGCAKATLEGHSDT